MNQSSEDLDGRNTTPVDYTSSTPRFSVTSDDELNNGIAYLKENGYVVISDVMNQDEINVNKDLLWKFFESASSGHLRRDDPDTWSNAWPGAGDYGVINGGGIGQSDFLWNVRSQQQIKHIFSRIWNTSQLFVSFDGCGIFRDWSQNPTWKTEGNWSHVDQNPKSKPNACCIQGLVAFTDQDETTGGLVVYPRSHLHFTDLCDVTDTPQDFVRIPKSYSIVTQCKTSGKLVHCRAGDFVLWDSRTIHCNSPAVAIKERRKDEPIDLLRIVAYVSMSPISFVHGQTIDEFREKRKQMLENNCTLTHWSTELVLSNGVNTDLPKVSLDKFTAYQKALIFGYDNNNV